MPCAERGPRTHLDLPTAALRVASALIPRVSTAAVPVFVEFILFMSVPFTGSRCERATKHNEFTETKKKPT